jgi:preprotein translocase subunit SecB
MAEDTPLPEPAAGNGDMNLADLPQVQILTQYVKDLSFENPNAPAALQGEQPRIEVNVNVNAKGGPAEGIYEVELKISIKATAGTMTAFICELLYGGLFGLKNVPDEALEPFLVMEAPRLLFPFARRIIADCTRDGGYPPLMLDPIDFASMYFSQQQQGGVAGHA